MQGVHVRGAQGAVWGAVALLLVVTGPVVTPGAGAASNGQPAFTTFEAPGGAATTGQRVIALTFDDGPGPYTPQVLSVLERYQVPATFFEIGEEVAAYPQYSKMVAAAGFPVEDHTWSHPDLTTLPASSCRLSDRHDPGRDPERDWDDAAVRASSVRRVECQCLGADRVTRADDHELLRGPEGLDPPRRAGDRERGGQRRVPRCGRRYARRWW